MTFTDQTPPPHTRGAPWWWPQMRDVLALLSTLLLAGAFLALFMSAVHEVKIEPTINQALGQFTGAIILQWGAVMAYFFGTTRGAVAKDATIATMATGNPPPANTPTEA